MGELLLGKTRAFVVPVSQSLALILPKERYDMRSTRLSAANVAQGVLARNSDIFGAKRAALDDVE
jgi:hypothetical protein